MDLEEMVKAAELTDIDSCNGEEASTNFGQWLRIYHASLLGSDLEKKAMAKMIQVAKRNKTSKDRNRRIVKWQEIFAVSHPDSNEESFAAWEILKDLKRLKKEMKRGKSSVV